MKPFWKIILHRSLVQRRTAMSDAGITLIELLAAVTITGVLAAIAAPNINFGTQPVKDTTNRITASLKLTRAKAMSQTSAYRLLRNTSGVGPPVVVQIATRCTQPDAEWTQAPGFVFEDWQFDEGVNIDLVEVDGRTVTNTDWSLCFDSRGYAAQTLNLALEDENDTSQIQVFRGGIVSSSIAEK